MARRGGGLGGTWLGAAHDCGSWRRGAGAPARSPQHRYSSQLTVWRAEITHQRQGASDAGGSEAVYFFSDIKIFAEAGSGKRRKAARVGEIRPPAPVQPRSHWRQTARAKDGFSLTLSVRHQHQHRPLPASSQRRGRDDASDAANCLRSDGNSSEADAGIGAEDTSAPAYALSRPDRPVGSAVRLSPAISVGSVRPGTAGISAARGLRCPGLRRPGL